MFKKLYNQDDYWHGEQKIGAHYSIADVAGYYNDLRKKVLDNDSTDVDLFVPKVKHKEGEFLHPVTVCQVGLGAYDKYLDTNNDLFLQKAKSCANWLCASSIKVDDALKWVVPYEFELFGLDKNFHSGLIQGQAVSLLVRLEHYNSEYLNVAYQAYSFLNRSVEHGGCRLPGSYIYEEYPSTEPNVVLNGYISAIWGVWDLAKYTKDEDVNNVFARCIEDLISIIGKYDSLIWSRYCLKKSNLLYSNLASPYYHKEHIAQLEILVELTSDSTLTKVLARWKKLEGNIINKNIVICIKGIRVLIQHLLRKRS